MAETPYGGAYGLGLPQFGSSGDLTAAPPDWPVWSLEWSDETGAGPLEWSDHKAVLPTLPHGRAIIDRSERSTRLAGTARRDAGLLHPYLGSTALAFAAWCGRLSLHAGVVSRGGRAWGLLGERGAGKSSALMWWLTQAGEVVADDLLVTDGKVVFCGPRFVDLRAGASRHFAAGDDVGVLGTRRRWRVPTGPCAPTTPLAGLVELAWADQLRVAPIDLPDRMRLLSAHRGLRIPVDDHSSALAVLALRAVRFERPKTWDALDSSMTRLVDVLDG